MAGSVAFRSCRAGSRAIAQAKHLKQASVRVALAGKSNSAVQSPKAEFTCLTRLLMTS